MEGVNVSEMCRRALAERREGEDLEGALLRVCKGECGEDYHETFNGMVGLIKTHGSGRFEEGVCKIAQEPSMIFLSTNVQEVARDVRVLKSTDELSPEMRKAVEDAIKKGGLEHTTVGEAFSQRPVKAEKSFWKRLFDG